MYLSCRINLTSRNTYSSLLLVMSRAKMAFLHCTESAQTSGCRERKIDRKKDFRLMKGNYSLLHKIDIYKCHFLLFSVICFDIIADWMTNGCIIINKNLCPLYVFKY